jgi:hypothetical protein
MNEPESDLVTCCCNTCDGQFQFDKQGAGERVQCPHCGMETQLYIPDVPVGAVVQPPPSSPAALPPVIPKVAVWFGTAASSVEIRLTSGAALTIKELRLYDEDELTSLAAQKANAAELFQGVSSPFAAWGSVMWVVLATALTRMREAKLSNEAAQKGAELLRTIAKKEQELRAEIKLFPVGQIKEIENPTPTLWRVPPQPGQSPGFVHSGEEFVMVKDAEGAVHSIRWSAVEYYKYQDGK